MSIETRDQGLLGPRASPILTTGLYAALGTVWILGSDLALDYVASRSGLPLTPAQSVKGTAFVLLTALGLYFLLRQYHRRLQSLKTEIRAVEILFHVITDCAPVLLSYADVSGVRRFANTALRAFIGAKDDDAPVDPWTSRMHPADLERYREVVGRAEESGGGYELDYRARRADGAYRWLHDVATPYLEAGVLVGYAHSLADTTDLRKSDAMFRDVIDLVPAPINVRDMDGRYVYVNEHFAGLYGKPPEALIGLSPDDILDAKSLADVKALDRRLLAGESIEAAEITIARPNVGGRSYLSSRMVLRDATGEAHHIAVVALDVTERKAAERQAAETAAMLRSIMDAVPAAINVKDRGGRYVYINEFQARAYGGKPEDFVGRTWSDLGIEPAYDTWLGALERGVIESKQGSGLIDDPYVDRIGRVSFWMTSKTPVLDETGEVRYVVGVSFDVTERRRAEEALRQSEAIQRAIIDAVPGAVVLTDADERVVRANTFFSDYVGLPPDQIFGRTIGDLFGEDYAEKDRARSRRALVEGAATGFYEEEYVAPDGTVTYWLTSRTPVASADGRGRNVLHVAIDVTNRIAAERALRKSQERLDRANRLARLTYWRWNVEDDGVEWSDGAGEVLGIEADRLPNTGDDWETILHPDDRAAVARVYDIGTFDVREYDIQFRIVRSSGEIAWLRETAVYRPGDDGGPGCWEGMVQDVTKRVEAEREAAAAAKLLRAVMDSSLASINVKDRDGRYVYMNPTEIGNLKTSADELMGKTIHDLPVDQAYADWVTAKDGTVIETGKATGFYDDPMPTRAGEGGHWITSKTPVLDEQGEVAFIVGTTVDVTSQVAAAAALREKESLLSTVLDAVPALITVKDREGRFLTVNRLEAEYYGQPREWFVGKTYGDIDPVNNAFDDLDRQVLETGRAIEPSEQTETGRSGKAEHWLMSKSPVLDDRGAVSMIVTLWLDMTRQHQLQEQLQHGERLQTIGQLSGGIAHDFNNLLGVILGNLELALRGVTDQDLRDVLDEATNAAAKGAELTARLLAFGRKQTLQPEPTDVCALLKRLTGLFRRTLGKSIKIQTAFEPSPWLASIDPGQLEIAIVNLVINARDAMPAGGRLTIEAKNRLADELYAEQETEIEPGRYVAITISDSGSGMSPEVLEKAFEPFFTTKEVGKGTGLGLSMVYGFVNQSGGHVRIYSEPGLGTSVRLLLPATGQGEEAMSDQVEESIPHAGKGEVVFLVEDDAALRGLTRRQLTELGYEVVVASDGPAALVALPKIPRVDLLLTDVTMPKGMNGIDLARAVREERPDIKVLFMSGYVEGAVEATSHGDLKGKLLNKPFRRVDLARRVRATIDGAKGAA